MAELRRVAEEVVADPSLWREVADWHPAADDPDPGYGDLAVASVLLLASRSLDETTQRQIAGFLLDRLLNTHDDADYERETLVEALGAMGPQAVLPELLPRLETASPDENGFFHALSLTELVLETDDADLQEVTRKVELGRLEAVKARRCELSVGLNAAHTLARMGEASALPLIEQIVEQHERSGKPMYLLGDYRFALRLLRGKAVDEVPPEWQAAATDWEAWLTAKWQQYTKGYADAQEREVERALEPARAQHREVAGATPPAAPKTGRNDPCPCGSGRKYKKCCLDRDRGTTRMASA